MLIYHKEVTDKIETTLDRIEAEKASDLEPGTTVRETIGKPLVQLKSEVKGKGDSFRGSVNTMLGKVETAEQQIKLRVNQATVALDSLVDKTSNSVEALRMQVETAVKTAETMMESIKNKISEFKNTILTTFETLQTELAKLQEKLTQFVDLLSSTLEKAMDMLDKIPAESLPKMLVNPTVSAIEKVIGQMTKQISATATKAGQ